MKVARRTSDRPVTVEESGALITASHHTSQLREPPAVKVGIRFGGTFANHELPNRYHVSLLISAHSPPDDLELTPAPDTCCIVAMTPQFPLPATHYHRALRIANARLKSSTQITSSNILKLPVTAP